ncbi:FAD binding domain-containing protein [Alphaproteobacteria bacterium]|nr:FAD binding domain-containing protein [Alphaproteobacteria bacterium]
MKAPDFSYYEAKSIDDAIKFKSEDDESVFLAGGQSLIPALNMRLSTPSCLIDISKLSDLNVIKFENNSLYIGALATHSEVLNNDIINEKIPVLKNILKMVAHSAIRNKGTHGGSIAYADPAAELPAFAVAMNAEIVLSGLKGKRTVAANDFYLGLFETDIMPDEMLIGINYPCLKTNQYIVFDEVCRRHGDYAMAGLIARVELENNNIKELKLVFFATGDRPDIAHETAKIIINEGYDYLLTKKTLNSELEFAGDLNSSPEMKLHLATILINKALKKIGEINAR